MRVYIWIWWNTRKMFTISLNNQNESKNIRSLYRWVFISVDYKRPSFHSKTHIRLYLINTFLTHNRLTPNNSESYTLLNTCVIIFKVPLSLNWSEWAECSAIDKDLAFPSHGRIHYSRDLPKYSFFYSILHFGRHFRSI